MINRCSDIVYCFESSPCGSAFHCLCNGKVCWPVVPLISIVLWLSALTTAVVLQGRGVEINKVFWFVLGLSAQVVVLSSYVLLSLLYQWGGIREYLCRVDGRSFPCYTLKTRVNGVDYTGLSSFRTAGGVGVHPNTPSEQGPSPDQVPLPPSKV